MKSMTNAEKVRTFMTNMGQDVDAPLTLHRLQLRYDLINEEFDEIAEAAEDIKSTVYEEKKFNAALLKELCDMLYVVYGAAITFGWDIDTAFNRVHESNMSKFGEDGKPIYREDGKVLKGPNYKKPDLGDLV